MHFKAMTGDIPICKKMLMAVTASLHVTYKIEKGSCFVPKQEQPKQE
jgi:hypothetical protein